MKPVVMTRKHIMIFWISVAISAAFALILYAFGAWVPSPFEGNQEEACIGAQQTLAELQSPQGSSAIDSGKIKDARDLVEVECGKA